jgi:hypothetical protein
MCVGDCKNDLAAFDQTSPVHLHKQSSHFELSKGNCYFKYSLISSFNNVFEYKFEEI